LGIRQDTAKKGITVTNKYLKKHAKDEFRTGAGHTR